MLPQGTEERGSPAESHVVLVLSEERWGKEFLCSQAAVTTGMLRHGAWQDLQLLSWQSALQLAWDFSPGLNFCAAFVLSQDRP